MEQKVLTGIALGSNLGDRETLLHDAVTELSLLGTEVQVASLHETDPVGCPAGSPKFLNTVMVMQYQGDLFDLLLKTQRLEEQAGRSNKGEMVRNAPRPLDLDILFYGQQVLNHHQLTLPHPRMMDRLFVLEPLAELLPDFRPYPDRPSVAECVEALKNSE